jgi:hypothetical protein
LQSPFLVPICGVILEGKEAPQIRWLQLAVAKEATPTNAIGQVQFPWEHVLNDGSAAGWFKVR